MKTHDEMYEIFEQISLARKNQMEVVRFFQKIHRIRTSIEDLRISVNRSVASHCRFNSTHFELKTSLAPVNSGSFIISKRRVDLKCLLSPNLILFSALGIRSSTCFLSLGYKKMFQDTGNCLFLLRFAYLLSFRQSFRTLRAVFVTRVSRPYHLVFFQRVFRYCGESG